MIIVSESNPNEVWFEARVDVPPVFDQTPPIGIPMEFDLPKDVDFWIHLGRHRDAKDFQTPKSWLPEMDIVLAEGVSSAGAREIMKDLHTDSRGVLASVRSSIKSKSSPMFVQYELEVVNAVHNSGVKLRKLDPTSNSELGVLMQETYLRPFSKKTMKEISHINAKRNEYALVNMKDIIDEGVPYIEGQRRQVLITRGTAHFGLLRALEFQTEYAQDKANGSRVVVSSVQLMHHDGAGLARQHLEY